MIYQCFLIELYSENVVNMRGLMDLINLFSKNKLRRIKKIKGDVYGYLNEV